MAKEEDSAVSQHESVSSSDNIAAMPQSQNFVERALRPTVYVPRYPKWMVGNPLLWATCFFGSLGDALFGYDQGDKCHFMYLGDCWLTLLVKV